MQRMVSVLQLCLNAAAQMNPTLESLARYYGSFDQVWADSQGELIDRANHAIESRLIQSRHGDMSKWWSAISALPTLTADKQNFQASVVAVDDSNASAEQRQAIAKSLELLKPWRKGPFDIFGTTIDTEWRSDWKWDRFTQQLDWKDKDVLDVGCGSGYHCWRMLGAGAKRVIGIDPSELFCSQFMAVKHFVPDANCWVLPMGIDDLDDVDAQFDTVTSMGVLYHRRSPLDHLKQLFDLLKPGGTLVLETLVVPGDETTALIPPDRYARMRNVWFLPSVSMLEIWLKRLKFIGISTVDITQTMVAEQRSTRWMEFESLDQSLDPDDSSKTIEGHPAPLRAVTIAKKKPA